MKQPKNDPTLANIEKNERLANQMAFDPKKVSGVGLADNSKKSSLNRFKFGGGQA